ncbi:hypothetical protein NDU88_004569 [Pleurodeles waltl]|uniref:Uncharacterized protein n=1 Tax=Pleurodeles waltl TaxID=8319 RepID=A0AAV7QIQ1_PLEWA|nr:hypothetical protein NDU88_004569 [Pleurodeles waltl]
MRVSRRVVLHAVYFFVWEFLMTAWQRIGEVTLRYLSQRGSWKEKEGSQEDLIRKIVSEEVRSVVQESMRQVLGKRKGVDDEEFYSLSEDEDHLRGPGGKCYNKKRHLSKEWRQTGVPGGSREKGTLNGVKEGQLDAEKEGCTEDFLEEDDNECVLDLEYKDDFEDEFGTVLRAHSSEQLLDPLGAKLFEPKDIQHPRGKEWWPLEHVTSYMKDRLRKPLEKEERSVTRAECSGPVIDEKVCMTSNLDPDMLTYLFKLGRHPRKGLEKSLKQVQDKLLDVLGPLARIFDTVEDASFKGKDLDIQLLRGWCQREICFPGNANTGLLAERRKTVLMRINSKLPDLANKESSDEAWGLLFGDDMVKALTKFVREDNIFLGEESEMEEDFKQKRKEMEDSWIKWT